MNDLSKHEQLEIEVLQILNNHQLLGHLTFGGGTMLRLCFGLNRYSIDLDFWAKKTFTKKHFEKIKRALGKKYKIADFYEKHFSYLVEIQANKFDKKLKIEIRKKPIKNANTDVNIAFSRFSNIQVKFTTFSLEQMFSNKVAALLDRQEIRDAYDLEFIFRTGEADVQKLSKNTVKKLIDVIDHFKKNDYKVKLGALLSTEERAHYNRSGFKFLRTQLYKLL